MTKVKVYQFTVYDITNDEQRRSRRWGTREAIKRVCGQVLEDTEVEVDSSVLGRDEEGMSERNFDPHPRTSVQQQVRS